jgi:K+-sensing histidine kinase KdpD
MDLTALGVFFGWCVGVGKGWHILISVGIFRRVFLR